jgi:CubicO group peptidase (beta-lactamase class C family)
MTVEPKTWAVPGDADIRAILVDRIDVQHRGVGAVVGVVDALGRRIIAHGEMRKGEGRAANADTVFEIGSITKTFTSLLLADMTQRGEVAPDDPVGRHLPAGVKMPSRGGRQITLIDLATHTSGLPRMDTDFGRADVGKAYVGYSVDQLYRFLGGHTLRRDIGERYEYSNLGVGLLGHVLALRAGVDFDTLVRRRIAGPMGMSDTAIALSPSQRARLAVGHDAGFQPLPDFNAPTLAGSGALRSTARDLLTFLAAELGFVETPLRAAMSAQLVPRRPGQPEGTLAAPGWFISVLGGKEVVWNGGTRLGYRCFLGFDAAARAGVVVLTNSLAGRLGDNLGLHLLAGTQLRPQRGCTALCPDVLERYVGRYKFRTSALSVTRDGDRLLAQSTNHAGAPTHPILEIYPDSPTHFFCEWIAVDYSFEADPAGGFNSVVMHSGGRDTLGRRLPEA